jgi:hypothetical protein
MRDEHTISPVDIAVLDGLRAGLSDDEIAAKINRGPGVVKQSIARLSRMNKIDSLRKSPRIVLAVEYDRVMSSLEGRPLEGRSL